jgi:hypothetical protein
MSEENLLKKYNVDITQEEKENIKEAAQKLAFVTMGSYLDALEKLLQTIHCFEFDASMKALGKSTYSSTS